MGRLTDEFSKHATFRLVTFYVSLITTFGLLSLVLYPAINRGQILPPDLPSIFMTMGILFIATGVAIGVYAVTFSSQPLDTTTKSPIFDLTVKSMSELSLEELRLLARYYCTIKNFHKAEEYSRAILDKIEQSFQ